MDSFVTAWDIDCRDSYYEKSKYMNNFCTFLTRSYFQYQTNLAIGGFMGVIVVMTNQCLILFAIFVDQSQTTSNTAAATQIYQGMAAFFFLLAAIYGLFCVLLGAFKDVIVQPGTS